MKDVTNTSTITTFKENITYLKKIGFKPVYNIIDNVVSEAFKQYLEYENIKLQLFEPQCYYKEYWITLS